MPASGLHEFDLILRPDNPVEVEGTRTIDGIDLRIIVVVRNRSTASLWVDAVKCPPLAFDGKECGEVIGRKAEYIRPRVNSRSAVSAVRIYTGAAGKTGRCRVSYLFGKNRNQAEWIFDVDVDFRIPEEPTKKGVTESLSLEIVADRSAYRLKPDEAK